MDHGWRWGRVITVRRRFCDCTPEYTTTYVLDITQVLVYIEMALV